ncbi:hypothetical protein DEU38_10124 [Rhodococcus sp. AG1013]|uniref:hypothetical protein n=1 Tax=Rhodococcus sp. AG1013 TaxID=2183996 RepID=UPI000E0C525D|nr:hypothetical protein [Rhodococcus sp. AG1013]RDI35548.1 hypothetical protein DEU38_10124 [Rhodococcus sp. AG1013]
MNTPDHIAEMRLYERILDELDRDLGSGDVSAGSAADAGEFDVAAWLAIEAAYHDRRSLSRSLMDQFRAEHPLRVEDPDLWQIVLEWLDAIPVKAT